ncbi:alpha/beta hydrolase [Hydrogenophaga sp. 2FB]|uniref:alpha/beta fold hydrolase n=1 Tax=Hydrogenophaga sp. 2FB TaxID=2502187 RepID=UPI001484D20B|nr:alpha/beta hydrolase [Hydrogenophaga sp. 2FB]
MDTAVLLHGFCSTSRSWDTTRQFLSRDFDLLAPDWPGFGSETHAPPLASIAAMAEHVLQLADARGLKRFHVVGHSMSGFVVQHLLLEHPERIHRAVLYGTFAAMRDGGRFESVAATAEKLRVEGIPKTVERIVTGWFVDGAAHPAHGACVRDGQRMSMDAAQAAMAACEPVDFSARLGEMRSPVLVITGDRDRTVDIQAATALARGVAGGALCVLPRAAHAAHLEEPELFHLALGRFLKGGP